MKYIDDKIDIKQFDGEKGVSFTHYLIEFLNLILYNLDLKDRHAVLARMIDFSKEFNKINHNNQASRSQGTTLAIKILTGFLSNRKLQEKYKGATS